MCGMCESGTFLPWPLRFGSGNWHISEENYCTDESAPVVCVFVGFKERFQVSVNLMFI